MQKNQGFSASCRVKNAVNLSLDYLAVPNNLLLSLSLSLSHRRYWRNVTPKHSRIRARGDPAQPL